MDLTNAYRELMADINASHQRFLDEVKEMDAALVRGSVRDLISQQHKALLDLLPDARADDGAAESVDRETPASAQPDEAGP